MNGVPNLSSFLIEYESLHANKPRSSETVAIQGTSIECWNAYHDTSESKTDHGASPPPSTHCPCGKRVHISRYN